MALKVLEHRLTVLDGCAGIPTRSLPDCTTYVLASPKKEHLTDAKKLPLTTKVLYLPTYSWQEIHDAKVLHIIHALQLSLLHPQALLVEAALMSVMVLYGYICSATSA